MKNVYSIGIYVKGSLVDSWLTEPMDEVSIEEHIRDEVQPRFPDATVDCVEFEEYDPWDYE